MLSRDARQHLLDFWGFKVTSVSTSVETRCIDPKRVPIDFGVRLDRYGETFEPSKLTLVPLSTIEDATDFRGYRWYRHAESAWIEQHAMPPVAIVQLPTDLYPDYPWVLADGWGRTNWASFRGWCVPARFYRAYGERLCGGR